MGVILAGRCECGFTCNGLMYGTGESGRHFDIDICYSCQELFAVKLPASSFGKDSAMVDVTTKNDRQLNTCPSCGRPGVTAAVVPYNSKDSDIRKKKTAVKSLLAKLFDSFKEPEYLGYCPKCAKHRLHLSAEAWWD